MTERYAVTFGIDNVIVTKGELGITAGSNVFTGAVHIFKNLLIIICDIIPITPPEIVPIIIRNGR